MKLLSFLDRLAAELAAFCCLGWHRFIAPAFGARCRYHPSCSQYAVQALRERGLIRGGYLSLRRVLRCNSFFPGGYEPLPPLTKSGNAESATEGRAVEEERRV